MPEICRFYGIVVRLYFSDHPPPHFHAWYGGQEAVIDIRTGAVLGGDLPPRALGLVVEWAILRRQEILACWERASRDETPGRVLPLE